MSARIVTLEEVKRRAIIDALDECEGNFLLAAKLLGIGKTTVYRLARVYGYQYQPRTEPTKERAS